MTDRDALYHAILANPEDDTPRLVYADWLDENGRGEEAEFIRLDCRLEAANPGESDYLELLDRQEELRLWLQTYSPMPQLKLKSGLEVAGGNSWWQWTTRGFPRFVFLGGRQGRLGIKGVRQQAAALEKTFATLPTRWLSISIYFDDLPELLKQPVVAALERLTIDIDDQRGDDAAQLIANCPLLRNLRSLVLNTPVGEAGAEALGQSKHLGRIEQLDLDTSNLSAPAIRSLGSGDWFRNLRSLTLADDLATNAFEELCRLPPCPHLHTLILSGNSFSVPAWEMFTRSKTFPQLTRLDINGTDMSDGRMAALASANTVRLTSIDLSSCATGNEGVRALIASPWAGSLRSLDLSRNLLEASSATAIARCRKLTGLRHLNLGDNPLGVTGLKEIAKSPFLRNLTTLHLSNCMGRNQTNLSASFHEFLQKLKLPKLRNLDLSNTTIGSRAARLLTDEKFRSLTRLWLGYCKLTDATATALLTSPTLQNLIELRLHNNNLKTGVASLTDRRILPRLSLCLLIGNPIPRDLCRKLRRRPGIWVPEQPRSS